MELLLDIKEIDINIKNTKDGDTALHIAVGKNNIEYYKLLLGTEGIDVNIQDNNGHTALHIAVDKNNIECLELLLGKKE